MTAKCYVLLFIIVSVLSLPVWLALVGANRAKMDEPGTLDRKPPRV